MQILTKKTDPLVAMLMLSRLDPTHALLQTRSAGNTTGSATATCQTLYDAYPDLTLYPGATNYSTLNENYFTAAEWLGPACIFTPTSAELMSYGVKTLAASNVTFAVRGGGHMPVAGAANIDSSGILLASSGLTDVVLSEDGSVVYVGSGKIWGDVYGYLEPSGKSVVAGRSGVVGVPGYLLGGGISHFGNEYGWASSNIASYECVLADGSIVNATADNDYSDLFWALRGGANNFAIVTSFGMKTLDIPAVSIGAVAYNHTGIRSQFLQAVYDFAYMDDMKAGLEPTASWSPDIYGTSDIVYNATVFYNGDDLTPAALSNFTGSTPTSLPVISNTMAYRSLYNWTTQADPKYTITDGLYSRFNFLPIYANLDDLEIAFDTFFNTTQQLMANVPYAIATLALQPITKSFIVTNRGNSSGDPFGIDEETAPFIWIVQTIQYYGDSYTSYMDSVIEQVNAAIDEVLPESSRPPFIYLNDADGTQSPFSTYASDNVQRMKSIMAKYDPEGLYTYQMPGGFKLANA